MKVLAINGSPRRDGNTSILIQHALEPLQSAGIETEVYQLGGQLLHGCTACMQCRTRQDRRCAITSDKMNEAIAKVIEADGIIIASPTYFADVTTETKALMDRTGYVSLSNGGLLRRKVGAAIVAVRRGGEIHAFDTINHFFLINQMIVPGSCYWNMGFGREKGEVLKDEEGLRTMKVLGENMAWLLKCIAQ